VGSIPVRIPPEVCRVASDELDRCCKIADRFLGGVGLAPRPMLNFDKLRGKTWGRAIGSRLIYVNTEIAKAVGPRYAETVGHEYAHNIVAWLLKNRSGSPLLKGDYRGGHGPGWKNIMVLLGLPPTRCPTEEEAALAKAGGLDLGPKTFVPYECKDCSTEFKFSNRRHNNVVIRGMRYRCHCGGALSRKM
jgi:predicted SprT family Zn-dependent metalloprotease